MQDESEAGSSFPRAMSLRGSRSDSVRMRGPSASPRRTGTGVSRGGSRGLTRPATGVVLRALERRTGLSRPPVTRLVRPFRQDAVVTARRPSARVLPARHRHGRGAAGRDGCAAWHPVRPGHQAAAGARPPDRWGCALRAAGEDLGLPPGPSRGGTPFPLVATCAKISEADLRLVIRQRVAGFPFTLLGFQAENGSAYSHDPVAELLEPLRIACTPSRPRHSHDTALAESTHGAVGRNPLGSAHRPQPFAEQVTACWATHRTPSVHVQRPCVFPETRTDAPGQARTRTRDADRTTP